MWEACVRIFIRFFALTFLSLPVCSALAQTASTAWNCWFDGDAGVRCLLRSVAPGDDSNNAIPGTRPAGDGMLPPFVHALRNAPASIEGPIIIPLHTYPYDMDFVRELTQSVMCGRKTACVIAFSESVPDARSRNVATR